MKWINDQELEGIIQQKGAFAIAFLDYSSVPCDHFKPEFIALDPLLRDVAFFIIVAEENPTACSLHNVVAVPTVIFWKDGRKEGHWEGPYTKEALKSRITEILSRKGNT
jgi:hypothetical protein